MFKWIKEIFNIPAKELSDQNNKVKYGFFYNSLIADTRIFKCGDVVWLYDKEKYLIVLIDIGYDRCLLHLSKTMNNTGYKDKGLVVDSREVKQIIRWVNHV